MASTIKGAFPGVKPLAVVTGASSGIGYELALQFARNGFNLIIASEDDRIFSAAEKLRAHGGEVETVQVDLATYLGVEKLYAAFQDRPIDALALNAGVGVYGDFARETELDDELKLIHLNVLGVVHLAKLVSRDMVARGKGRMLFTASVASTMPGPLYACYAASKAFVLSFSEAIRNELRGTGVTVTALMPGATDTDFFRRAGMTDTIVGQAQKDSPADVARDGFLALMADHDKVVAGSIKNKLQTAVAAVIPEPIAADLQRRPLERPQKKH